MLRKRFSARCILPRNFSRTIFYVPPLPHFEKTRGIPGLLTEPAFEIAWVQYQSMLLKNLNRLVNDTIWANKSPKEIANNFARDPENAATFNYASAAHNNHFFFESLTYNDTNPESTPEKFRAQITKSFGSFETLRLDMLKSANAMFGPGYVWLVKDFENNYSVLATYLAGSPYPEAHFRKQPVDFNTQSAESPKNFSEHMKKMVSGPPANSVGKFGSQLDDPKRAPGGTILTPVLCVSTWPHVYLPDYGFQPGKEEFTAQWWKKINWDIVSSRAIGNSARDFVL
ncbi:unnamed protein product [Blumeria hordei]|uniref:Manganese/iron superoxide dismutase C-terminal domain-containing protein n=1 Tax=Blumeria hordei TaxID=2867405 RepID=A0A383UV20_BLUHO|nr:unnamed protein product [Blumeria hordei]